MCEHNSYVPTPLPLTKTPFPQMARGMEFRGAIIGGESPKRRDHQAGYNRHATRLNYSPSQAQPSQDS